MLLHTIDLLCYLCLYEILQDVLLPSPVSCVSGRIRLFIRF